MNYTIAPHTVAFDLIRDAASLMDDVEVGSTTLTDHPYSPMAIRARRVYTPQLDTLTLLAYHGDRLAATIIASNNGKRTTARIHQIRVADVLFTRRGNWTFIGIGRVAGRRRRFTLTTRPQGGWRIDVNGEQPLICPDLDAAARHISDTYHPTS
ncbi:hypothetical protein [Mycobacterium avium]|uniref:hypothetical protein n=1 Tax=Mycobacterium avium TaxID=1764 RepID=UPI001CC4CB05|nr:hypothetical protein [Mycobacterium avium]MBZ4518393.1 hypothetical protein [Mycobacterium avium subsp. hominissuis]MBZ4528263.1 hypothetical protein [Mycobacterium avium subsp. hominissuis]MBZ4547479.1 hypothetical protein [Mycobacterium avium subsp. hominissuis]MBZ4557214.1 hypothetical protein [Mycobacterium avium subsp. hominissuis]MBZ4566867.1 hypothetical protein [Mycobacterium avium subsp. hominissuis]